MIEATRRLEVLSRTPEGRAHPTPLLFVHGAFSTAGIWAPFFLPYFARHGFAAHAVSLRGHGGSDGRRDLAKARLKDYVDDVAQVAAGLPAPPVVIGTSLGGIVVQSYLHRHSAPAAVLLASGPPHGMIPSSLRMMLHNPQLVWDMSMMQWVGPETATVESARRALFRQDTPDDDIRRFLPDAGPESPLAMLDVMGLDLPPSRRLLDVPVLVLGGEADAFITPEAVEATASTYGTRAEIFPGMPHAMMLDRDWERVAGRIREWLEATLPS
ncbi:MAG: alpha/beta fold hydrolase [Rhodospirillales bacterium]|nr:MAG: alpha/beta fold hydrolase [Rhodospirillales bacterium]